MTAAQGDLEVGPDLPAALRRLPLAPAEGWLTFAFVVLMALTVAWSLDDAAWVLGRHEWGDFYAWAAVLATTIGFIAAKVGWPRWIAHLVGAIAAALVLPVMVGSVIAPAGSTPGELYRATAESVVDAWRDLAILERSTTNEVGHFLLAIGAIAWSVGQFAGFAVFGHRRPLDGVIVVGIVLLGNISLTFNDHLGYLVIFSIAALCVLARTHAFEEETTWVRRRIGDAAAVRSIYLRGGAVFIALAVFGSLVLTASASSAPLGPLMRGVERNLIDWSQDLQRYLPFGGQTRATGFGFGRTAPIHGLWQSSNELAVQIRLPGEDRDRYYWRAVTFDRFEGNAWSWTDPEGLGRAAGEPVLGALPEEPTDVYARREVSFSVEVAGPTGSFLVSPQDPLTVDRPSTVQIVGEDGWLSAIEVTGDTYTVTAAVPVTDDTENALTANRLRAAGEAYPEDLLETYTALPPNALGPDARALLDEFLDALGTEVTPYDLADAIETRLRGSPEFRYREDVRGLCDSMSTAECFARHKVGYCLHYATTMAVLLREAGVPARLVEGFLPGQRDATGLETIVAGGAHAWVEVWFPGFGWYPFDPTGGGRAQSTGLRDGPTVTPAPSSSASARPIGSVGVLPDDALPLGGDQGATPGAGSTAGGSPGPAVMIAVAVVLLVGVLALAFVAWQRGPRGEVSADAIWQSVARLAGRFGFGPRPQETVYEYAGTLGEVLPASRPELQTVANAKVEVAYGGRQLTADAHRALRDANRRLRVGLLRLAFRRKERKRLRRRR